MWLFAVLITLQGTPGDTLWSKTGEGWEITVSYPGTVLAYPELDSALREYATWQVAEFERQFLDYYMDDPFIPDWTMEINFVHEPSPEGMVCVSAWLWDYTGGAHGNSRTGAFIYSIPEKRLMDTVELLGGEERFQSFAESVVEFLKSEDFYDHGWVESGAGPNPANYHTVLPVPGEDGGIEGYQVIFPPYQVDCYATGTVEVYLPADWESPDAV